ncbi:flavin reductase family protein [Mycobacterium colombiense]|uniref:flavin reductase family protein n=1 Tax=Mycobacterium colombiense TaxID=339268 RepID=UPI00200B6486|nr:flavin reductase family protein [Mycobacterium colombiense]MCK8647135.1 flavin reductase family protein [Mycobacterium colombiense]
MTSVEEASRTTTEPTSESMRRTLGRFMTGVTVVTAITQEGQPAGCTVSAFSSLSLDPPLVLVCVNQGRNMHHVLETAPGFAVNILRADQRDVALSFAHIRVDRFAGLHAVAGRHRAPLLDGAIAHVECDRYAVLEGGDHRIVVGRVRRLAAYDGEPLLYASGRFLDLSPCAWDRAPTDVGPDTGVNEWMLSASW